MGQLLQRKMEPEKQFRIRLEVDLERSAADWPASNSGMFTGNNPFFVLFNDCRIYQTDHEIVFFRIGRRSIKNNHCI